LAKTSTERFNDAQRLAWLRLIRSENIGPAVAAIEAVPDLSRRGGRQNIRLCTEAEAEAELKAARRAGMQLVARRSVPDR